MLVGRPFAGATRAARVIRSSSIAPRAATPFPHTRWASSSSSSSSSSSTSSSSSSPSSQQAKPASPTTYERQRQREWILIGVSGLVASAGAYVFWSGRNSREDSPGEKASTGPSTFVISGRSPITGERMPKVITLISPREINRRLTQHERTEVVKEEPGKANLVARYDTNSVASNDPIEDRRAEAIVESASSSDAASPNTISSTRGNLAFFAVMDGHSGYHTSQYLSQKLIAFVAVELDKVFHETGDYAKIAQTKAAMPVKLWQSIVGTSGSSGNAGSNGLNGDPEIVKRAITRAFVGLDKEIVNSPIELLKEFELSKTSSSGPGSTSSGSLSTLAHSIFPAPASANGHVGATATQRSAYEVMKPALSGSCALLTYIDSAQRDVYVACTGDSRAIAGWYDPRSQKWSIEPLSTDQTGRNPSEVRRMQSEHPGSESDTVIMRGRVLGGLEPTRAFGDARYKWTADLQKRLREAFVPNDVSVRAPSQLLQTPPYVTARPEIEWRRLPSEEGAKQLKFIVMATDGLWDMLSNEEVGSLVAGHLADLKGHFRASQLQESFLHPKSGSTASLASSLGAAVSSAVGSSSSSPSSSQQQPQQQPQQASSSRSHGHHPLSRTAENTFTFQDSNLATHLVRNALGGANQSLLAGLMSIPAPDSRRYRDDITVNVILLNDSVASEGKQGPVEGGASTQPPPTKAKL